MSNKLILNIDSPDSGQGSRDKTLAEPSRRLRRFGRRRLNEPQIRFWDLGQVNNNESLDDEPVWSDHPILKTPSYSTTANIWGSTLNWFAGVEYLLESFTDADYQAYTDLLFGYPVTEWKRRYRRILGIDDYGDPETDDYRFDMRFSLRDNTYSGTEERFMPSRLLSQSFLDATYGAGTFATQKETYLTDYHHYWHNDKDYAGYRDLDRLEGQYNPFNGFSDSIAGGYFPYSTTRSGFKVTATNDPDADAVTLGTPSGSYDIFLIPQVGMFAAVSHSSDYKTSEVLGLCYQVMPRKLWPRYVEGLQTNGAGQYGSDSAVSSWMNYQIARSGVQYSSWTYTGTGDPFDYSYSETSGVPADWTGLDKWGGAVNGSINSPQYYYRTYYRGSGILSDNQTDYTTVFNPSDPSDLFGNNLFQSTSPLLTAVIQKGSQFYYVWDTSHLEEGFGNYTASKTIDQNDRFRLSRNITWHSSFGNPPQPLDGTGAFYDL